MTNNYDVIGQIFRKQPKVIKDYIKHLEAIQAACKPLNHTEVSLVGAAMSFLEIRKTMQNLNQWLEAQHE